MLPVTIRQAIQHFGPAPPLVRAPGCEEKLPLAKGGAGPAAACPTATRPPRPTEPRLAARAGAFAMAFPAIITLFRQ